MFEIFHRYPSKKQKSDPLSGNALALYLILSRLSSDYSGTIKIEGRHISYGSFVPYHDTLVFELGSFVAHVSYAPIDYSDYERTHANLFLRLDNVDVATVIRHYLLMKEVSKEEN